LNTKDTNPKDAIGTAKVPFSTIPAQVMAETGLALMEGALKYGRHNYRSAGVRASVYYDAALRHLTAFWEGQNVDPDSGLPHVVKAIACLTVLRDSQIQGNWTDDRPPATPGEWVQDLNLLAKDLLERHPNPLPAHTAVEAHTPIFDLPPVNLDDLHLADWEKELVANGREAAKTAPRRFKYLNGDIPPDVWRVTDPEGAEWHRVDQFCDADTWVCQDPRKSVQDAWTGWFTEVVDG